MILITGAAGFIGSCMASYLNESGREDLVLCDRFDREDKAGNYRNRKYYARVERDQLFSWLAANPGVITCVIHLGARTDTTETDPAIFELLNFEYSKNLWAYCTSAEIPFIYASSAATYGDGKQGFSDDPERASLLKPMNPYGWSKHAFDQWATEARDCPPLWVGLKFFNVYGPNEYHKGRMASVILHAYHQIKATGELKLFRSHRPEFGDGEQMRDFIYVKDVVNIIGYLTIYGKVSGIYNLGTGKARYFKDLGKQVFKSLNLEEKIRYIDTPVDIRESYQYYTEADMGRFFRDISSWDFYSLEDGADQYIREYLMLNRYY
ncbi:MAG: ADP-glyceromanno-heptose 6-epimerase [Bacteroidia bacterium]